MKLSKQIPITFGIGTALLCGSSTYAQIGTSQPDRAADGVKLEEIIVTAERRWARGGRNN